MNLFCRNGCAERAVMIDHAILYHRFKQPMQWLSRAARAREIALMLSKADAKVVEAYAAECEAKAILLIEEQRVQIAA
jgi:hypothetical protein